MAMTPVERTIQILRARPGIDVSRQKEGTGVIIEAGTQIYHLRLLPKDGRVLVELSGTDPRLRQRKAGDPDYPINTGLFLGSAHDPQGTVFLDDWIGADLCMAIRFKNGVLTCPPTKSATVVGENYRYDVF